jgi:16S rRNA (cytosine1402-N4)-methyltransferase
VIYHKSVLLKESIQGLAIKPDKTYVDITFGGGGHSKEILKKLTTGKLIAFDKDQDAKKNKIDDSRFILLKQDFRYIKNFLKFYKAVPVDGIIADLGVSSYQFDTPERGFSTRFDGDLDMRMDTDKKLTAMKIVNDYTYKKLKTIFFEFGEIKNASNLAKIIINNRNKKNIKTTSQLKTIIASCVKKGKENKYYAKVFQALRIEVNDELDALKEMLLQTIDVLNTHGRLVVISYHSLEDRLVKNFIKSGNFEGIIKKDFFGNPLIPFKKISKKPIVPKQDEISDNSRCKSAKLRIAEKI